jgi:hypothetical protein
MIRDFFKKLLQGEGATDLRTHLSTAKKVKIRGVIFHLKKIQIMDYLEGARVMQEMFSVYKTKAEKTRIDKEMVQNLEKAKKYMTDIIMAGVIKPELTRDPNDSTKIHVDEIFNDWIMAQELTKAILELTHGKKN